MIFVRRMLGWLQRVLEIFLAICMTSMILVVLWQVFTRFILKDPSTFTDELSRYLLIWIGILGGSYTFIIKRHLALEILSSFVASSIVVGFKLIVNVLILILSGFIFLYGGLLFVSSTFIHHQISSSLHVGDRYFLMGYVYLVLPISGSIILLFGIADVLETVRTMINRSGRGRGELEGL